MSSTAKNSHKPVVWSGPSPLSHGFSVSTAAGLGNPSSTSPKKRPASAGTTTQATASVAPADSAGTAKRQKQIARLMAHVATVENPTAQAHLQVSIASAKATSAAATAVAITAKQKPTPIAFTAPGTPSAGSGGTAKTIIPAAAKVKQKAKAIASTALSIGIGAATGGGASSSHQNGATGKQDKGNNQGAGSIDAFKLQGISRIVFATPPVPGKVLTAEERAARKRRQERFEADEEEPDTSYEATVPVHKVSAASIYGVGTCESLEKEYFRLTSLPLACNVRPPNVLAAALKLQKAKWLDQADYAYTCEQLKSIRQDLTVQGVRGPLAVDAYETHGRIALETGDTAEFRQCHAVLQTLYAEGAPGSAGEFGAYGLLFTQCSAASLLASELSTLPAVLRSDPYVTHALAVCSAVRHGDHAAFMQLYSSAQRMVPYLMDRLLPPMRRHALTTLITAYRPTPLPLLFVATQLGFDTAKQAERYVRQHGGVLTAGPHKELDTRLSALQPAGPPRPATA